jgi:hypothetical protein
LVTEAAAGRFNVAEKGFHPSDAELLAFAQSVLGDLEQLREPELLAAAISDTRELWLKLYEASLGREHLGENR